MTIALEPRLAAHLSRHARKLYRLACGLGRASDADDVLQTLYIRWWQRMNDQPGWLPPESSVELFVCVRRAVLDVIAKERRERIKRGEADARCVLDDSPEDSLVAFERLSWILTRLPQPLAEALMASLCAGRRQDAEVARELGVTTATYTMRLHKARRAAEELASFYEVLPARDAHLLAELRFSGKPRAQIADEQGLMLDELSARHRGALDLLDKLRGVAS